MAEAKMVYPLLMAHLLGDFALQADWMVQAKQQKGPRGALPHVSVIALLTYLAVSPGIRLWWLYASIVVLTHLIIDVSKVAIDQRVSKRWISIGLFLGDQLLHWAILFAVADLAQQAGIAAVWELERATWDKFFLLVMSTFVLAILFRVFVPSFGWPNRWPATFARAGTLLYIMEGQVLLAPLPLALSLGYHHLRGQKLTRAVWVEALVGTLIAVLCGLIFRILHVK